MTFSQVPISSSVFRTRSVAVKGTSGGQNEWAVQGSNLRPFGCKPNALPIELTARDFRSTIVVQLRPFCALGLAKHAAFIDRVSFAAVAAVYDRRRCRNLLYCRRA